MKIGEWITIERQENGLYAIHVRHKNKILIGGAASTAISVMHEVFAEEATEPKISVRGDCGLEHSSIEEWKDCQICGSIINRNLASSRA
jgi:hypothetical protein